MLGSIPFFIASGKNKRKAATTLGFDNQNLLFPLKGAFVSKRQSAVTLKIGL
jgi:hypothetical protein